MHFTLAVFAAHRTRLYYTPTEQNCYWFANAILYILRMEYTPSEPPIVDDVQGTWSLGPLRIPLGSLSNLDGKTLLTEYAMCKVEESGMPVDMDLMWARWEQAIGEDQAKFVQEVRARVEQEVHARVEQKHREVQAKLEQEHREAQAKLEQELREEQAKRLEEQAKRLEEQAKRLEEQAKREAAEARAAALQAQLNAGKRSSANAP